jgi:hypothetical protein
VTDIILGAHRKAGYRESVAKLEAVVGEQPQVEMVTNHYFAHGTYTRELIIPAGTVVVGKLHINSCINIVTKGRVLVATDEGDKEIVAPHVFVSGAGVKKAVYAIEETIWLNVHPWSGEPDLEQIEKAVIAPSYEALELIRNNQEVPCLGEQSQQ